MKAMPMILTLFVFSLLLTSCNAREDVQHVSPEKMTEYVKTVIREAISFVSVDGSEDTEVMTYLYRLDDRNVTFEVTSVISALGLDGSRFGNYKEEIYVYYEECIAESAFYKSERLRIGNELNIHEEDRNFSLAQISVHNYKDIEKLAHYAIALDNLYGFDERKPDRALHITLGALSFKDPGSAIEGPAFSTYQKGRLKYDVLYDSILNAYLKQLVAFDGIDESIPQDIWERYNK